MEAYELYVLAGLLLVGLEIFVPGFVVAPLGIATLATALAAYLTDNLIVQSLSFAATAAVCFWGARRFSDFVSQKKRNGNEIDSGIGLKGKVATLIQEVKDTTHPGRVKLYADEFDIYWPSEVPPEALIWKLGHQLKIKDVYGNKVLIER